MGLWTYVIKQSLHSSESKMLTDLARDAFEIIECSPTQVLFFAALFFCGWANPGKRKGVVPPGTLALAVGPMPTYPHV